MDVFFFIFQVEDRLGFLCCHFYDINSVYRIILTKVFFYFIFWNVLNLYEVQINAIFDFSVVQINYRDRNQKAREITPAIILFETIKTDELYNMYTV